MNLCQYKNILGTPGKGFHNHGIIGFAYIDVLVILIMAIIIRYFSGYNVLYVFLFLFIIGTILHIIFCVDTAFIKLFK